LSYHNFLKLIKADLYRYAGKTSLGAFLFHYFLSLGFRYTVWMRWCAVVHANAISRVLLFPCAWLINRHQQIRFGIAISYKTQVGPGAKIFGKIAIGNNAAVGANCVVTKDVPENGVVVGIPGKVISYEGSAGCINRVLVEKEDR
jgi:serine O-acetyltransferase